MKKLTLVITFLAFTNVLLGQILSVTPNKGVVGQQLSVTITGNIRFYQASTVENVSFSNQFSNFLTVNEVVLVGDYNSDNIKVSLTIPNDANPGDYNVNIFNKDTGLNETLTNGFKVLEGSLSTNNFATFNTLKVYPNPFNNLLKIENNFIIDSIQISSALGQKMIFKKVNKLQTEISLNQLANGIYFVKIVSKGNEKTVKIIKE